MVQGTECQTVGDLVRTTGLEPHQVGGLDPDDNVCPCEPHPHTTDGTPIPVGDSDQLTEPWIATPTTFIYPVSGNAPGRQVESNGGQDVGVE